MKRSVQNVVAIAAILICVAVFQRFPATQPQLQESHEAGHTGAVVMSESMTCQERVEVIQAAIQEYLATHDTTQPPRDLKGALVPTLPECSSGGRTEIRDEQGWYSVTCRPCGARSDSHPGYPQYGSAGPYEIRGLNGNVIGKGGGLIERP